MQPHCPSHEKLGWRTARTRAGRFFPRDLFIFGAGVIAGACAVANNRVGTIARAGVVALSESRPVEARAPMRLRTNASVGEPRSNGTATETTRASVVPRRCAFGRPAFARSEPTALASYPGCGSTMTRLLIELATSRWTGSVYSDWTLFRNAPHAFRGEMTMRSVIAVKTHFPTIDIETHALPGYSRIVLILRDPHRAIPSHGNYWYGRGRERGEDHKIQAPLAWWEKWRDDNFQREMMAWVEQIRYWWRRGDAANRFMVIYEDLIDSKRGVDALRDLVSFLGANASEERLSCAWHKAVGGNATGIRRPAKYVPKFTAAQECALSSELSELADMFADDAKLRRALRSYSSDTTTC